MKSRFAWMLCSVLLAGCDKPGPEETSSTGAPSASPRSVRAERGRSTGPRQLLRTAVEPSEKIESIEVAVEESTEAAWNSLEANPKLACEVFRQLPADHPEKIKLILHYAMNLADADPDEAIEWAGSLDTEREIAAAHGQIAVVIAESDPERAATLLSDSGIDGHECDVAIVQVVQRWAARSPQDAAAWAATFPAGAAREAGLGMIVSQWVKIDPVAALTWMDTLPDEEVHDEAVLAMEKALLQQPREVQAAWLLTANYKTRSELEAQRGPAMEEIGDNVPLPVSLTENSAPSNAVTGEGSR